MRRALIVDSQKKNRDAITAVLASYGMRLTLCRSATEAMVRAALDHYEYIIIDYDLTGMDGLALTRWLRKSMQTSVIIGMCNDDKRLDFLKAGANDFLQKPFLHQRIGSVIDAKPADLI